MSNRQAAGTYVQISRDDFEDWLKSTGFKWERDRTKAGLYTVELSPHVGVLISSSIGSRDDAMGRAQASVKMRMISRHTGQTLNKKAQGRSHFKRTKGWKTTWKKGLDEFRSAYMKAKGFYDKIAQIEDRQLWAEKWMAKIEALPGWEANSFLKQQHDTLRGGKIISDKVEEAIERIKAKGPTPQTQLPAKHVSPEGSKKIDDALLTAMRQAYAAARQAGRTRDMEFLRSVAEKVVKRGLQMSTGQQKWWDDIRRRYRLQTAALRVATKYLTVHFENGSDVETHTLPVSSIPYLDMFRNAEVAAGPHQGMGLLEALDKGLFRRQAAQKEMKVKDYFKNRDIITVKNHYRMLPTRQRKRMLSSLEETGSPIAKKMIAAIRRHYNKPSSERRLLDLIETLTRVIYGKTGTLRVLDKEFPRKTAAKGEYGSWNDFLNRVYDGGKKVKNPNPATARRRPEVSFSSAYKHPAFKKQVNAEYQKWLDKLQGPVREKRAELLLRDTIRLAAEQPGLRPKLLPALREATLLPLLGDFAKEAEKWESKPKGWTDASRKKFWESLTGGAPKHKVSACMKKMEGNVADTGAFCGALADRVLGKEWRSDATAEVKLAKGGSLTLEEVRKLCPPCAEKMAAYNLKSVKASVLRKAMQISAKGKTVGDLLLKSDRQGIENLFRQLPKKSRGERCFVPLSSE